MRSGWVLHHPPRVLRPPGSSASTPRPPTPAPAWAPPAWATFQGVSSPAPSPPPRALSLSVDTSTDSPCYLRKRIFAFLSLSFPLCEMDRTSLLLKMVLRRKEQILTVSRVLPVYKALSHHCVITPLENPRRAGSSRIPVLLRCSWRRSQGKAAQELCKTRLIGADSGLKRAPVCPGEA